MRRVLVLLSFLFASGLGYAQEIGSYLVTDTLFSGGADIVVAPGFAKVRVRLRREASFSSYTAEEISEFRTEKGEVYKAFLLPGMDHKVFLYEWVDGVRSLYEFRGIGENHGFYLRVGNGELKKLPEEHVALVALLQRELHPCDEVEATLGQVRHNGPILKRVFEAIKECKPTLRVRPWVTVFAGGYYSQFGTSVQDSQWFDQSFGWTIDGTFGVSYEIPWGETPFSGRVSAKWTQLRTETFYTRGITEYQAQVLQQSVYLAADVKRYITTRDGLSFVYAGPQLAYHYRQDNVIMGFRGADRQLVVEEAIGGVMPVQGGIHVGVGFMIPMPQGYMPTFSLEWQRFLNLASVTDGLDYRAIQATVGITF